MAVAVTINIEYESYGKPAEDGGPHGEFFGAATIAGDGGGGASTINLNGQRLAMQGRLFLIRRLRAFNSDANARIFQFSTLQDRAQQGVTPAPQFAGLTIVGFNDSVIDLLQGQPFLWRPAQNLTGGGFAIVDGPNVNAVTNGAEIEGQYWELSRLRKAHISPLIRW